MPSFPKCERHGEGLCPLCSTFDVGWIKGALINMRRRLVKQRNQLTKDIVALDKMIEKAKP